MKQDQLERLLALRDRLLETAMIDADPANWVAGGIKPCDMTREERGDAKWCRSLAVSTVALTMQVERLAQNPLAGGATVPTQPTTDAGKNPLDEEATVEAEIARYERAADKVLKRAARVGDAKH